MYDYLIAVSPANLDADRGFPYLFHPNTSEHNQIQKMYLPVLAVFLWQQHEANRSNTTQPMHLETISLVEDSHFSTFPGVQVPQYIPVSPLQRKIVPSHSKFEKNHYTKCTVQNHRRKPFAHPLPAPVQSNHYKNHQDWYIKQEVTICGNI